METIIFNGKLLNVNEVCTIIGVEKTKKGKLRYLIKWKTKNTEQSCFIDSYIMRTVYPQMLIEFFEKITIWN